MTCSKSLFDAANAVIAGGVNSPARAFKAVGGSPFFARKGEGAYLISEEGKRYLDFVLSFGPLLFGHAEKDVVEAVQLACQDGTSFGATTAKEVELAELVQEFFPSCEKLRFVNSGTEATMSAVRLARGHTGRPKILKFNGCYHGHVDSLLVSAGSSCMTLGTPDSAGVLPEQTKDTLACEFNDVEAVETLFQRFGQEMACVIVEPICGNMGVVLPDKNFLKRLRELCSEYGALLIFDEVMCGFRVPGFSAQGMYAVIPDLTCLGKVVGGGLPCAAYGGRSDIMRSLSPEGPVFQAGTLSGNPLAMAAGIAMLKKLKADSSVLDRLVEKTKVFVGEIRRIVREDWCVNQVGTLFTLFSTASNPKSLKDVNGCDFSAFALLHRHLIEQRIYFAPSQYEANFTCTVHSESDFDQTLEALCQFFRSQ